MSADGHALLWPGRVLTAEDLRRNLNGHASVALGSGAIVTPAAREHLLERGIRLSSPVDAARAGYARDREYPFVAAAIASLAREGLLLAELSGYSVGDVAGWSKSLATDVARGDCRSLAVFCTDPGLTCCVANKVAGLRAVAVTTIAQMTRAANSLSANFVAVEMPGRTYFEVLQVLRMIAQTKTCPTDVASTLQELDGHAHS
jgi:ribose 5-phosphate isomerase RpiB